MSGTIDPHVALDRSGPGQPVLLIRQEFSHSPDRLWRALTDDDELSAWFPCRVKLDLRTGGTIHFLFPGEEPDAGQVLEVLPEKVLAFSWDQEVLRWTVEPAEPGRSTLALANSLQDPAWAARVAAGWHQCIEQLGALLDGQPAGQEPSRPIDELVEKYGRLL
ncbi:ATPase [Arthrobacter sp. CAU 1506]|uniref:SRPBCC domain-containing protein n=1 Tax=Arthrobacter sp. CAU 1506 TaxID=2560052 RepID=UPI0010AC39A2|nr:SRPBCC domain-containing protein [Arthrobacter sp. CAU 1506]TJY69890.1 ATPase [Arthrobacter sp. CAU 1506]